MMRFFVALLLAAAAPRAGAADAARCAACYISYRLLSDVLNTTKTDLELSKEANDRKAQKVDRVQKAQTKRWLKQEYKVALAAAVEERLEKVCAEERLFESVCAADEGRAGEAWPHWAERKEGCREAGRARCRALVEERADELSRAALDVRGWESCQALARGCEVAALRAVAEVADARTGGGGKEPPQENKDEV